ncbi:methyltransferase domain protein [Ceratobasidium sp. AG-Ba]|nr:methyltransferase domain protein [Ceratobasidium sp. AG-Ba]
MADAAGNTPSPPANLIEIDPNEYHTYYFRRNGRDFPLHRLPLEQRDDPTAVTLPSILPADRRDMERRIVQHHVVNFALGGVNYFGPFRECLTPPHNKVVLDVGSASGKWIEEVSDEFHHVPDFHGVEIVPRSPTQLTNAWFVVYDFQREGLNHEAASVDVVHARFQNWHFVHISNFLAQVAKVLKPGGLFLSGELDLHLEYLNAEQWPATAHLYNLVYNHMRQRGYTPDIATGLSRRLESITSDQGVPLFTDCESRVISIPVGRSPDASNELGLNQEQQRELPVLAMDSLKSLSSSLKPFLLSLGFAEVEVNGPIEAHRRELEYNNAKMTYRMTWARRR